MKKSNILALGKALKKIREAQATLRQVADSDNEFKYCSNSIFIENRVEAAISVIQNEYENVLRK